MDKDLETLIRGTIHSPEEMTRKAFQQLIDGVVEDKRGKDVDELIKAYNQMSKGEREDIVFAASLLFLEHIVINAKDDPTKMCYLLAISYWLYDCMDENFGAELNEVIKNDIFEIVMKMQGRNN